LSSIAQSAAKFSNDIRLLQSLKEIEEPFSDDQIGSSAMAYKRNPILSERIASLARYVIVNALNPCITASTQWLERTLDDSANRRICIPEAFLAVDTILNLYLKIAKGMKVYPKVIEKHLNDELPFIATENILMNAVKCGGDRQKLHERIRLHAMEASKAYKEQGKPIDLLERISQDASFNISSEELKNLLDPKKYIGRAKEQTEEFINERIKPKLK
jgi:adenylosuccinate lyase